MHSQHIRRLLFACLSLLVWPNTAISTPSVLPPVIIPPAPAPTVAPALPSKAGPSATITFPGNAPFKTRSKSGLFRLAGIRSGEAVEIKLQFPIERANTPLVLQALDGGSLTAQPKTAVIAADGSASFRFQAGDQPGLYRVAVIAAGGNSTLKFWVADPKNPKANPPVLNPGH